MPNPQTPQTPQQPHRDPSEIERVPGYDDRAPGPGTPDRHPDPLKQPGDAPDVKPDVIANQGGGQQPRRPQQQGPSRGIGTPQQDGNPPRPGQGGAQSTDSAPRRKPGTPGSETAQNRKQ